MLRTALVEGRVTVDDGNPTTAPDRCEKKLGAVFSLRLGLAHLVLLATHLKLVQWRPRRSATASSLCFAAWGSPRWRSSRAALLSSTMRLSSTSQALHACPPAPTRALKALTRALSPSAAATLRSNNLGGMGPGPSECNDALPTDHQNQSYRCGFHDLDDTHPYYRKMGASLYCSTHAALIGARHIRSAASWCGSFR